MKGNTAYSCSMKVLTRIARQHLINPAMKIIEYIISTTRLQGGYIGKQQHTLKGLS